MATLNPNPDIEVISIGDIEVIVVDNVLSNPDEVREYGIESYKKHTKNIDTDNYLFHETKKTYEIHPRPKMFEEKFPDFGKGIADLIHTHLGPKVIDYYNVNTETQQLQLRKGPYFHGVYLPPMFLPHVDDGHVSSFLYLNPPNQCWGGTGIYRHIPSDRVSINQTGVDLTPVCRIPLKENLTVSTPEWNLEYLIEMKYNRFCAFNSSAIHKIYWPNDNAPYKKPVKKSRFTLNNFFKYE